jgi:AcrR family transcriptional regulator
MRGQFESFGRIIRAAGTVPLTRRDWLEAGQKLLRAGGVTGLKLRLLARSLNISTGSFYHHFANFDVYLGELARYYSGEQLEENLRLVKRRAGTPFERLLCASQLSQDLALPELIAAMRAWARHDQRAASAVTALETTLGEFLAECFLDLGFTRDEAYTRAFVLLSTASGEVALPPINGGQIQLARLIIDLVCQRPPAAAEVRAGARPPSTDRAPEYADPVRDHPGPLLGYGG